MGGNYSWFYVTDVTAADTTVKAGEAATLTVKFTCDGDLLAQWFRGDFVPPVGPPPPFDYEVKVYLEKMGRGRELNAAPVTGSLVPNQSDYEVEVITPKLPQEGIYEVAALVELSSNAGFVMGFYDGDLKISVWTPQ
jgi:hypothetical protein